MENQNTKNSSDKLGLIQKPKLRPIYYPGEQGPPGNQRLIVYAVLSPIIIVTSPIWIPQLIHQFLKEKLIDYKFQHLEKDFSNQNCTDENTKTNKKKLYIPSESIPIVISKYRNKKPEMIIFSPKNQIYIRWQQIQKKFKAKNNIKQSIFFFAGSQLLNSLFSVVQIYNKWKSQDQILYVSYQKLEVFG